MDKLEGKIRSFKKALITFNELIKDNPTDVERDAAIQRFEYCFELAWKSLQEVLKKEGFTIEELSSPKKVIKTAFQASYIANDEIWITMLQERNLTSHTYNEQLAKDIYNDFKSFYEAMIEVVKKITKNETLKE